MEKEKKTATAYLPEREAYEAPVIEISEVMVERGFQDTDPTPPGGGDGGPEGDPTG